MSDMRRKDREMTAQEAGALLKKCEHGVLSLISPANTPYAVPLNYVYIEDENALYVHCALKGRKLECLEKNSAAFFTVVGSADVLIDSFTTLYESASAFGTAALLDDAEDRKRVLMELCAKYYGAGKMDDAAFNATKEYIGKHLAATAIIKMNIEGITGKANNR